MPVSRSSLVGGLFISSFKGLQGEEVLGQGKKGGGGTGLIFYPRMQIAGLESRLGLWLVNREWSLLFCRSGGGGGGLARGGF